MKSLVFLLLMVFLLCNLYVDRQFPLVYLKLSLALLDQQLDG